MRKIPSKNYIILAVLIVVTVLVTLFLSNLYISRNKLTSSFYQYSNKIAVDDFTQYTVENPDSIIYISDKYDLTHETFEQKLRKKIDNLNLKGKLVFIDKSEINKKFINNLKKNYKINIDTQKTPIILVMIDKNIMKSIYIDEHTNVESFIDYTVFE